MVFIFIGMFFALMANIYWYKIKDILKKNGFKADYLFSHFDDLGNFQQLINRTQDVELKNNHKKILYRLKLAIGLCIVSFIGLVFWMIFFYAKWDGVSTIFGS